VGKDQDSKVERAQARLSCPQQLLFDSAKLCQRLCPFVDSIQFRILCIFYQTPIDFL